MLQQRLAHLARVGGVQVDLVDRDDDRYFGRLGVADGFDRLRHDAVVGRDHQHDNVGDIGAARTHGGEGLVARSVEEGDLVARAHLHLIGADVLGDATRFACGNGSLAQRVEQRRLAVVDVSHDGDNRSARLLRLLGVRFADQADLDVCLGHALQAVTEFGDQQFGGVGIDGGGDRHHHAHAHQCLDDVDGALGHAVGEFLDGDRLGHDDVTHDLLLLQVFGALPLLAFTGAAHGGERAGALVLFELIQREAARAYARLRLGAARHPTRRFGQARTPHHRGGSGGTRLGRGRRLGIGELAGGGLLALALGLFFLALAGLFFRLPLLGLFAFACEAGVFFGLAACIVFGAAADVFIACTGAIDGTSPRRLLIIG